MWQYPPPSRGTEEIHLTSSPSYIYGLYQNVHRRDDRMSLSWELLSIQMFSAGFLEGKREFRSLECVSKQWDILSKFKISKTILQS